MVDAEYRNIFDNPVDKRVPVKVVIDGKELTVGEADVIQVDEGLVHVSMNLATDAPQDVVNLFSDGITGYSVAEGPKHRSSEEELQAEAGVALHDHKPVQHRDGKPRWCNACKLTAEYKKPESLFNFGTPSLPLRGDRDTDSR